MRALIILVVVVVILLGALFFLSGRAHEVPTHPVEIDVTNAASH
jgi:hypothetical protein